MNLIYFNKVLFSVTELERFQLDAFCGQGEITDDAIFNGLLKMPSLTTVGICVSSQVKIQFLGSQLSQLFFLE